MKALTQDSTGAFPGSIAAEMMFVYVFFWAGASGTSLQPRGCCATLWDGVGEDVEDWGISLQQQALKWLPCDGFECGMFSSSGLAQAFLRRQTLEFLLLDLLLL